ncbi:prephenate dehydratase [Paraeggerthella hongkongensis]|uniref:Prephenate dehydratase n=1 Tax=Paraeggerthella hongkongensis TaxID=230658 RepID=A0A3N0B628_9ACTN|nr:prephenate dehydratase [Paraeggerthella hongkongensis]RNL42545.1 prephenate dehydratase [Paraeggerthella hongkongensis]
MTLTEASFAYLGPAGTYSDEAARSFAARLGIDEPNLVECPSFSEVFDCVDRGRCAYGVVAMENALEGPVTATLDNFAFRSSATILGEAVLDIHHCLLVHPESDLTRIKTVASHPQGLAQCRRYLNEQLPGRATITTSSTAESARLAASDPEVAGIGNSFAAKLYGARVAEAGIEDHYGNQTSFALIGRQGHPPVFEGERFKTSLALFLQADKAGALLMILSEFAYAGINLTKIQSRPTKQALGEYMFFVDLEGSVNDLPVQTALNCLRLKLREVKVLGSYPVG